MPGRPDEHIVLVQPTDGGWTVVDDREDEPIWFGSFEQALGEAIACGARRWRTGCWASYATASRCNPAARTRRVPDAGPQPRWPLGLP